MVSHRWAGGIREFIALRRGTVPDRYTALFGVFVTGWRLIMDASGSFTIFFTIPDKPDRISATRRRHVPCVLAMSIEQLYTAATKHSLHQRCTT